MPKPTTAIDPKATDIPFYYVRVSPELFQAIEAKRVELGFNKKKSVEVMADWFLTLKPGATVSPKPRAKKSKAKKPTA